MADILHATIDIETFSQSPTAAIISIGACTFDKNGIKDEFKVNIKPESAQAVGMTISANTVQWWSERPKEVLEMVLSKGVSAEFALKQFHDWYAQRAPKKVWAQGVAFDMTILDHAFKCVNLSAPWRYTDVMDSRTLFAIFGISSKDLHAKAATGLSHDPLEDCRVQTNGVITVLNALGWQEVDGPIKV